METRRLLRDEINSFGSVLGKHSLFIMILIVVFLSISVFFHCTIIVFRICLIDAVQGGTSCLMLKKSVWLVDSVLLSTLRMLYQNKAGTILFFCFRFLEFVIVVVSVL